MVKNSGVTSLSTAYATYSNEFLMEVYGEAAARIKKAISDISFEELHLKVRGKDKWSIAEIILHIIDAEMIGAVRFKQTITQSDIQYPAYDQDIWANTLGYQGYSKERFYKMLDLFELLRWQTLQHLQHTAGLDWNLTGVHKKFGTISLRNLLELYTDHVERHMEQINEIRQMMGLTVTVPILIQTRLY